MVVKIEEIQAQGLDLTEPIKAEVLQEALSEAAQFGLVSSTPLKVSFKKVSGRVHLKGAFNATVKAPCKRCAKDVQLPVAVEFALRMIPEARPRDDEDDDTATSEHARKSKDDDDRAANAGTFELDEVDAEPFDGKKIDLDPIVREQVLLALPVSVVCRDDCKGLCGRCGQDLNEKDCGHGQAKDVDPRLAKLKDIKLKN